MRPLDSTMLHDALEMSGECCARRDCWEPPASWSLYCHDHARSASWRDEQDAATAQRVMVRKAVGRAPASGW
jgi:hypothetical protein